MDSNFSSQINQSNAPPDLFWMNRPKPTEDELRSFEDFTDVMFYVVHIATVICTVGNSLVLIVMIKEKTLRQNSANFFIIALTAFELFYGLYFPIITLAVTVDTATTYLWKNSISFAMFTVLMNLQVALSADRYWAVCHPLSYFVNKNSSKKKWTIFLCIISGVCIGIIRDLELLGSFFANATLRPIQPFLTGLIFSWMIGSTAAIIILYAFIYAKISKSALDRSRLFAVSSCSSDSMQKKYKGEVRMAVTMSLVIFFFLLCWMPFMINMFAKVITGSVTFIRDLFGVKVFFVSIFTQYFNCAIDPFIYAWRIKEVRSAVSKIFLCKVFKTKNDLSSDGTGP